MIQYYNPNLKLINIFNSLFIRNAEDKIIKHFKEYSGKKHILITGSCRAALYLTYKALEKSKKIVATSPLTCFSAIQPILLAGKEIEFIDINIKSLNLDINLLTNEKLSKIDILQIIHHGGVPINYLPIRAKIKSKNIIIIEDCAQAYGALYSGKNVGSEADVSCFSLIKNLYGVGGGILATDNFEIFDKAKELQRNMSFVSSKLVFFRIFRNFLETFRKYRLVNILFKLLMSLRPKTKESFSLKMDTNNYSKPSKIMLKINAYQLDLAKAILPKQKERVLNFIEALKKNNLIFNNNFNENCSFTKLFVYNPRFNSIKTNSYLNKMGIESKHLEQKYGYLYQERFDKIFEPRINGYIKKCKNYLSLHDTIISLPLPSNISKIDLNKILDYLNMFLDYEKNSI